MKDLFDLPFDDEPENGPPAPAPADAAAMAPDAGAAPTAPRIFTVSELTARVRNLVEGTFPEVWVEGEISNCRVWSTGHLYFTLKDAGAQLKAVMWRSALRSLRFKPEDGLHVVARGALSVYEPKGEYQIVCDRLEPRGLGALQLAFDQLKRKLHAEGLFDAARKRPMPALPRRIGVVTSLDGAAIRDIVKVLDRRHPNVHLVIRPTRVQGEGAAADIARGLEAIARVPGVEVVIVGRGGGSIEDLWAFNEEVVARAIVASPIPVISAVGHETDVTIADMAADLRAPTPSAAAEIVVARKEEFADRVDRFLGRARAASVGRLERARVLVHRLEGRPAFSNLPARVMLRERHLSELAHALGAAIGARVLSRQRRYQEARLRLEGRDLRRHLSAIRARLVGLSAAIGSAAAVRRHLCEVRLREVAGKLDSLSPLAVLSRGYAVCWTGDRRTAIRDASDLSAGSRINVTLSRGSLDCTVDQAHASDRPGR